MYGVKQKCNPVVVCKFFSKLLEFFDETLQLYSMLTVTVLGTFSFVTYIISYRCRETQAWNLFVLLLVSHFITITYHSN